MGIEIHWDQQTSSILVMTFHQHWAMADFHEALHKIGQLAHEFRYPYDVIVDCRQMKLYSSAMMLDLAKSGIQRMSPNFGCVVVLTSNSLLETLARTASALYPTMNHRLYTTQDFTTAYKIIERYQERQQRQAL
ncbi:MAG: hypothetical protein KC496_02365 [Anaerolineae bacterium]|nr:hypothetical protein [Anaerolineae bacterium]